MFVQTVVLVVLGIAVLGTAALARQWAIRDLACHPALGAGYAYLGAAAGIGIVRTFSSIASLIKAATETPRSVANRRN